MYKHLHNNIQTGNDRIKKLKSKILFNEFKRKYQKNTPINNNNCSFKKVPYIKNNTNKLLISRGYLYDCSRNEHCNDNNNTVDASCNIWQRQLDTNNNFYSQKTFNEFDIFKSTARFPKCCRLPRPVDPGLWPAEGVECHCCGENITQDLLCPCCRACCTRCCSGCCHCCGSSGCGDCGSGCSSGCSSGCGDKNPCWPLFESDSAGNLYATTASPPELWLHRWEVNKNSILNKIRLPSYDQYGDALDGTVPPCCGSRNLPNAGTANISKRGIYDNTILFNTIYKHDLTNKKINYVDENCLNNKYKISNCYSQIKISSFKFLGN